MTRQPTQKHLLARAWTITARESIPDGRVHLHTHVHVLRWGLVVGVRRVIPLLATTTICALIVIVIDIVIVDGFGQTRLDGDPHHHRRKRVGIDALTLGVLHPSLLLDVMHVHHHAGVDDA